MNAERDPLQWIDSTTAVDGRAFEAFIDELAAAFARVPGPDVDQEIDHWLKRIVLFFDADRSSVAEIVPQGMTVTHSWVRPGYPLAAGITINRAEVSWLLAKFARGESYAFSNRSEIPPEAGDVRATVERLQLRAYASAPIAISDNVIGAFMIGCIRQSRPWPDEILRRLRLIATIFGNALARKRATHELVHLSHAFAHAGRVAAMGQLALSLAHEINQPLGASRTNAQTALQLLDAPQPDLAEVRGALADIAADTERASEIVHELRRFIRRQEPALSRVGVDELLGAIARFVAPEAKIRGVEVVVDAAQGLPHVIADRVQIQQVFVNLLLNAFDALEAVSPEHRRVVIAAGAGEADRISFWVSDNGPGIPAESQSSIFEPFVTTKPDGLGIGLAIVRTFRTA